jgi:transposase
MQFAPVKTEELRTTLMLARVRQQLIKRHIQLSNAIRGYATEFGLIAATGLDKLEPLLVRIAQDESLPELAREMFAMQGRDYAWLQVGLKAIEAKLQARHRANADSRRLAQIPGDGPIGTMALVMKAPDPCLFPLGRHFAAWIGLTPRDHSTAGKTHRQDHPRRRSDAAQRAGGGSHRRDPAGETRPWPSVAQAPWATGAQAAKARAGGACQQDCPDRMEAVGDG